MDIVQGLVGEARADALVNPCDARGSLAGALGGIRVREGFLKGSEGEDLPGLPGPGSVAWTMEDSFPNRLVIHALFVEDGRTDEKILRQACRNALALARSRKVEILAFPPLFPGEVDFPSRGAVKILAQEILKFARTDPGGVKRIVVCLDNAGDYDLYLREMSGYINHIQNELGCGPYVTVDIIIEHPDGLVVIERSNPPFGLALPGGFVDPGESLEAAARREAREETGLALDGLRQFHTYSDPDRDPRFHTVTTVFVAQGRGVPQFGDDAKGLRVIPKEAILSYTFAFDHKSVLQDYLNGSY